MQSGTSWIEVENEGQPLKVHFDDLGSGDKTLLMLHGSGPGASGTANFVANYPYFVEAGYRVVLMDCPGWGQSDPVVVSGSRSELNARCIKALVDHLQIDRVSIIGNSMGAQNAVVFALNHPERVDRLVLMGGGATGPGGPGILTPMPAEGIKLIGKLYHAPTLENLKAMMEVFVYDAKRITPELHEKRLANIMEAKVHCENFVKSMQLNPKQFGDYSHRLHEIKAPTLVIWGRDDRFVPLEVGLRLIAGISHAHMHIFNQCGHWVQWEHADAFNRLVHDFMTH